MHHSAQKLADIMNLEREIYRDILDIEEKKSEAISGKEGKLIEELSVKQEKFLTKIESLEAERFKTMSDCRKLVKIKTTRPEITLQDVIDSVDDESGKILKETGVKLKKILVEVKKIQDLNSQMLKDNMEFYEILISGLKNSSTLKSGYGKDGKEKGRVFNPVLFNIKA